MDELKALFGEETLTFAQLSEKLKDNKEVKLANLASGKYVDKSKLDDKITELGTANTTIQTLQDTVKKFDGVDVEKLKGDLTTLQTKYAQDIAATKLDSAVNLALITAKVKNPKLAKAALDLSVIKMDGEALLGLNEQIENLKKSDGYLFEAEDGAGGAHVDSGSGHGGAGTADFDKMSDSEYYSSIYKKG